MYLTYKMLKNDLERFLKDHGNTKVAFLDEDGYAMYYNDVDGAFCYYKNCGPVFTVSSLYENLNDWDEEFLDLRVLVRHTEQKSLYNICPEDDEKEYFFEDTDEETGESIIAIYIGYEDEESDEDEDEDDED